MKKRFVIIKSFDNQSPKVQILGTGIHQKFHVIPRESPKGDRGNPQKRMDAHAR